MPYLEDSTPSETRTSSKHASTEDSVFVSESNNATPSQISSPASQFLEEVLGVQEGNPLKDIAKYTFDTIVDIGPEFKCPCD